MQIRTRMKEWFREKTWEQVYEAETADETASIFQNTLLEKLEEIFPEKIRIYLAQAMLESALAWLRLSWMLMGCINIMV